MRSVALDLGSNRICYCEVREGKVVDRATVRRLSQLEERLGPDASPANVAFEAGRDAWSTQTQLLRWGKQPWMVDTTRVRQLGVGQHGKKTDAVDAETLARAMDRGGVPLAHVLSAERQELRFRLSVRRALVESRAQLVVTTRELARAQGDRLPACAVEAFVDRLRTETLGDSTRAHIAPMLRLIEQLDKEIVRVEAELAQQCKREPVIERLATAPGVGLVVAAAFVSVVDDAQRFRHAHQLQAYLGLVPSENSSGDRRRLGHITKHGNSYARAMLVQAAWCILRCRDVDDPLVRWGRAVAERRGKVIAAVAVARRLVGVLWSMWRHDTIYAPDKLGLASARGTEAHATTLAARAKALRAAARKLHRAPPQEASQP